MIAALSPADINYEETLSTLRSDIDAHSVHQTLCKHIIYKVGTEDKFVLSVL